MHDTIARCWLCAGDEEPPEHDAQRAALCAACERQRIRHLMGLDGARRTPLAACTIVDDRSILERIVSAWGAIVGDLIASYSRPVALQSGILTIECTTSACAHELRFAANDIIRTIAKRVSGASIARVQLRVPPPRAPRRHSRPLSAARILRRITSAVRSADRAVWSDRAQEVAWWLVLLAVAVFTVDVVVYLLRSSSG